MLVACEFKNLKEDSVCFVLSSTYEDVIDVLNRFPKHTIEIASICEDSNFSFVDKGKFIDWFSE